MSSYSYCQSTYPKILVIDKDTVVAITKEHAIKINLLYNRAQQYKEINDSLLSAIDSCKRAFALYDNIISGYQKEVNLYKIAKADRDSVIKVQKDIITDQRKEIKQLTRKVNIFTATTAILGVVVLVLLVL